MHKTRTSCFGAKQNNTTVHQAKANKHVCWKITEVCDTTLALTCCSPLKARVILFREGRNITFVTSFEYLIVFIYKDYIVLN